MNQTLRKLFLLILLVCTTHSIYAYDFEVDGFYYKKLTDSTVAVTCNEYNSTGSRGFSSSTTMPKYSGSVTIPATVSDGTSSYQVVAIDEGVFYKCTDLVSVVIPKNVTSIGAGAFYGCNSLPSINIPDGVTDIRRYTFSGCSGLTTIKIPNGVTTIGSNAFSICSGLTSINIPDGVTSIGSEAFSYCSGLTSINIPDGVTTIESYVFQGCSGLTSIKIPDGVTSIGVDAFNGCSRLTSINIPKSVTSIGGRAFFESKIREVNIASIESWMNIKTTGSIGLQGYNLFVNGQNLTDLVIPESITTVGVYKFYGCTGLESITIHKDVTLILQNAFKGCSNVKKIVCQGDTPPTCGANALTGISRTECTLYVPTTSGSNYQNTAPWSEFTNIVANDTETPDTPETCAVPTITFDNNTKQLKFESTTSGAKYHCTVTSDDMMTDKTNDGTAQMTGVYTVTAYASADGMYNSEKATAKLVWVNAEISESTDVISANTKRGVIVSTDGGNICISGTVDGETINVYNAAGSLVKNAKATSDNTVISGLNDNSVYVVKIGGTSVKVVVSE